MGEAKLFRGVTLKKEGGNMTKKDFLISFLIIIILLQLVVQLVK